MWRRARLGAKTTSICTCTALWREENGLALTYVAMASSSGFNIALKTFNLANDIKELSAQDETFIYDPAYRRINNDKPWVRE